MISHRIFTQNNQKFYKRPKNKTKLDFGVVLPFNQGKYINKLYTALNKQIKKNSNITYFSKIDVKN